MRDPWRLQYESLADVDVLVSQVPAAMLKMIERMGVRRRFFANVSVKMPRSSLPLSAFGIGREDVVDAQLAKRIMARDERPLPDDGDTQRALDEPDAEGSSFPL
jgi:hypothetical protein